MAQLPIAGLFSHQQRVLSLYKRSLRQLDSWYYMRHEYRYHAVLLRARFDSHQNETNMIKARKLVDDGEEELFQCSHYQPKKFHNSPGGNAYGRVVTPPDWILDYWHPLEKAQYPDYFARREQRKKEYVAWWEKQYGKPTENIQH